jgi:hypothetical protein
MRILAILLVLIAGYYLLTRLDDESPETIVSANGFILLLENNISMDKVIVLTSPNRPSKQAQRANMIVDYLSRQNIPYVRASSIRFKSGDEGDHKLVRSVMSGNKNLWLSLEARQKEILRFSKILSEYQSH